MPPNRNNNNGNISDSSDDGFDSISAAGINEFVLQSKYLPLTATEAVVDSSSYWEWDSAPAPPPQDYNDVRPFMLLFSARHIEANIVSQAESFRAKEEQAVNNNSSSTPACNNNEDNNDYWHMPSRDIINMEPEAQQKMQEEEASLSVLAMFSARHIVANILAQAETYRQAQEQEYKQEHDEYWYMPLDLSKAGDYDWDQQWRTTPCSEEIGQPAAVPQAAAIPNSQETKTLQEEEAYWEWPNNYTEELMKIYQEQRRQQPAQDCHVAAAAAACALQASQETQPSPENEAYWEWPNNNTWTEELFSSSEDYWEWPNNNNTEELMAMDKDESSRPAAAAFAF